MLIQEDEEGLSFNVGSLALERYSFPDDSLVFVEAYQQTNWMRFSCGHLSKLSLPKDRRLTKFDDPEGVLFRIKITSSDTSRKLIGIADKISPRAKKKRDTKRDPLLPVKHEDLGQEIYSLDFSGDAPILLINPKAGNKNSLAPSDVFLSLVYPAVIREILNHIILIQKWPHDSSDDSWQSKWLTFSMQLRGVDALPKRSDIEGRLDWIEQVIRAFSKKMSLLGKFKKFWGGDE